MRPVHRYCSVLDYMDSDHRENDWVDEEFTTQQWMRLVETGGAFEFWTEPGEDIYSQEDGEPI